LALVALLAAAERPAAAELEPRTSAAYDAYVEQARRAFVARTRNPMETPSDGVLSAVPAREDGIIGVPGGLIHHWAGTAFARGVTFRTALDVSTSFSAYSAIYRSVLVARLEAREGDVYRVVTRLQESEMGIQAILDVRWRVEYRHPSDRIALALSNADEIREVKNAGRPGEYLLTAGRDSGYLWRASTFTYFREERDGLYIETETVGLSRPFPPLLGWFIEPIARRIGRRSVETTLQEFLSALRQPFSKRTAWIGGRFDERLAAAASQQAAAEVAGSRR
jgi:hypothetical protein